MKAHCLCDSQPVFKKTSKICPYLLNSALNTVSLMLSGKEPTKILDGPSTVVPDPGLIGSLPFIPWLRASITSTVLSQPSNLSNLSVLVLAVSAASVDEKVMKAQCLLLSQPVFKNKSVICPYFENSSRKVFSVIPSGNEPTKIFLGRPSLLPPGPRSPGPSFDWFRAIITSTGLSLPGNLRILSVPSLADKACAAVPKVTMAH
mmetsp:Transcript_26741/g.76536  ORF Transcript_26741/g.76536 Transcript_26741/m.76536 type:complete len:204 (-) Transcript_26741:221-832(-)